MNSLNTKFLRLASLSLVVSCSLQSMIVMADPKKAEISPQASSTINALQNHAQIKKAYEVFETLEPQSKADLITLTEIPAPPFHEQERAKAFAQMLKAAGADSVEVDALGNVIALRKGSKGDKTVAIAAHLDTVFPVGTNVKVKVEGEKIIAPGVGDNTRGLVVVLNLLRAMVEANIRTENNILFVGTLGEEGLGDLRGSKFLFSEKGVKIDSFIAIDGGDTDRVVFSGIGSNRYRVKFNGSGGHSWGAFGYANPHHALGKAIAKFSEAADKITSEGVKTSYNVGIIGGGTSINAIPFESWMEVDMRSRSVEKLNEIDQAFKAAMQAALDQENTSKRKGTDLTLEIEEVGKRPVALGDKKSLIVNHVLAAMASENINGELTSSSTDSNIPLSLGIPAVTLSRGGVNGGAHSPDEYWENTDGTVAMRIALLTLIAEANMVK